VARYLLRCLMLLRWLNRLLVRPWWGWCRRQLLLRPLCLPAAAPACCCVCCACLDHRLLVRRRRKWRWCHELLLRLRLRRLLHLYERLVRRLGARLLQLLAIKAKVERTAARLQVGRVGGGDSGVGRGDGSSDSSGLWLVQRRQRRQQRRQQPLLLLLRRGRLCSQSSGASRSARPTAVGGDAAAAALHVSDNVLARQFPQLGKLLCVVGNGELQDGDGEGGVRFVKA
jgi:hypothetical protein